MKFTCSKEVLLKEISIAQEIISSKNAILILSNIYLEVSEKSLIIKAKDMKVNFQTEVPVTVIEPGATTVYGEKFFGIINSFPHDEIEFSLKDNIAIIKPTSLKKPEYKLKSMASEKFPEIPVSTSPFFEMPIKDFKEMVQQSVFAVSDDETRYFMNGVYFEKSEDVIYMVSTDGRRLAYISKPAGKKINDFKGIIIPPKILNTVLKRSGDEGTINISVSDKMIFINFASYQFSSVLIEGMFPNYKKVIPEKQEFSLCVKREEMLDALRRVSLMVEKKSHRIYLGISSGRIAVFSEESEMGTVEDEIPCKYEGEEITIALNYRYMEEPFKIMTDNDINIRFSSAIKAITIEPVPAKDFFHIVMPMQS
ncbi:MAG: DNA polymerase III subunit beta [Treponema sp.]|nr:DNA polymerase III subunit beta [Treponema sp.]MCL2272738.1 DNA polymerase III subunit beta [Treponema sp.]